MIGAIVELFLSWVLLRLFGHRGLSALGLWPTRRRVLIFLGGLLIPLVIEVGWRWVEALVYQNPYRLNPVYGWKDLGLMSWYLLKSVAFEDLAFRGALLYILARRLGPRWALWMSAVAFGIYHWFSFDVFGRPVYMIVVFVMTALAGWVQGKAYLRTGTIWVGLALHFSTDLAGMGLFGEKNALFIKAYAKNPVDWGSWVSLGMLAVHLAIYISVLHWYVKKISPSQPLAPL